MIKKVTLIFILLWSLYIPAAFAEDVHQDLSIWFERKESVWPNPFYPNCIVTDYLIYLHWSPPAEDFCHYGIYKDGAIISTVDKNTTSYQVVAFGGGWCGIDLNDAYAKYKSSRDYLLGSFYNHNFKVGLNRGCMGITSSIFDEVLVKPAVLASPVKEVPLEKATTVGHPINVASGNMFTAHTDILLPDREVPLELSRTYNAGDDFNGQFGYGWRSNFDITLSEQADMTVTEVDETGVHTVYSKNVYGAYTASAGKYSVLAKNADSTFMILRKHGKKLYFDIRGRLIKIEGRNGNAIIILRGADGAIEEIAGPSGRKLLFTNDTQGRVIQVADPAGRLFKYDYDTDGNLIKVTDAGNNTATYQYDAKHKLITETDANGHSFNFEYDADGRAYRSWQEGNNNALTLSFDTDNSTTTVIDSRGNAAKYEYNTYGLVTKITDAQNSIQTTVWDADMNKASYTDKNLHTTTYTYESKGNLLSITDPLGQITIFTYEPGFDFIKTATDAQGNVTTYDYDQKGNVVKLTDALGYSTTNTYDNFGQLTSIRNPKNFITTFTYDQYGNLAATGDTLGNVTTFSYDILSNRTQVKDAKDNITYFAYNNLNQLTQITFPDKSVNTFSYDALGNKVSIADNAGNTTTYVYDLDNRLASITNPLGKTVAFEYDTEGNCTKVIDQGQRETTYQYDSLNRRILETNPLSLSRSYTYDPVGNRASLTDAKGNTLVYEYDSLNRLEKIKYPDNSCVSFSYDSLGRRITMTDSQGTTSYTYDKLGRLTQVNGPQGNDSLQYAYDELGNRTSLTLPDGRVIHYAYDALNRISSLSDCENKTTTYTYDEVGNPLNINYPNNIQSTYTFDALHRLTRLTNHNQLSQTKLSEFIYGYDTAGRRSARESLDGTVSYTYDSLGELTAEVNGPGSNLYQITYEYDSVGNRTRMLKNNTEHIYTHNSADQLTAESIIGPAAMSIAVSGTVSDASGIQSLTVNGTSAVLEGNRFNCSINLSSGANIITVIATDVAGNTATKTINVTYARTEQILYLYDNNGNLVKKQSSAQELNLNYDYENRLISSALNGINVRYSYDGEGKRIAVTNGPNTINYFYDGLDIFLERSSSGDPTAAYLRNPYAAGGIGGIISMRQGVGSENYYSYDGLGSIANLSDDSGTDIRSYSYDAFGNTLSQAGAENRHQFLSKEMDPSGLIYFGARYYDPVIGRFITPDPSGMIDGPNLYLYCFNNPANWVDPWGLCVEVGFKWIYGTPFFHTGIRVTSPNLGIRSWGFNPREFSLDVLLGKSVPGKIDVNESYSFYLPISKNPIFATNLYRHLKGIENLPPSNYDLYGRNVFNCYTWRDTRIREENISGGSWQ